MNQVLSYNNYNPIVNPLSNTYSPPVTPTRPCDLSYFSSSGPRPDYAYEGHAQYNDALKWEPDSVEERADKFKNFPGAPAVTSECGSDGSGVFSGSSPVFAESKLQRGDGSDYDASPEVYDEGKYTDSTASNLDFADSPDFAEPRNRSDESARLYQARVNNNNNLEYDKSRMYESDRYNLNSSDQGFYSQTYPYNSPHLGAHNPPKMELYDMDQDFKPYPNHLPTTQLYDSCLATRGATFDLGAIDGPPPPRRRNTANKKERKRTLTLNKAFSLLRACIPNVPTDTKLSKIKTLKLAKEYIVFLLTTLNSSDPSLWAEGFKADKALYSPRKAQAHGYKSGALKASNENTEGTVAETRKSKGRTGWPQDVWAFELKPQQFSSTPPVRV